jgi:tetratricopeptide (TPR) repeat protein
MKSLISVPLFCFCLQLKAWSQPDLILNLQVQDKPEAKAFHDQPVMFSLTLINENARETQRWNLANDRQIIQLGEDLKNGKVKKEDFDKEKKEIEKGKIKSTAINLGSASEPWFSKVRCSARNRNSWAIIDLQIVHLIYLSPPGVITLDENNDYSAYFGVFPANMEKIRPGEYDIQMMIGDNKSNLVTLIVRPERLSDSYKDYNSTALLETGRFYWLDGNPGKALTYTNTILNKVSSSPEALALRGDIYIQQKKYPLALNDFNAALKEFNKLNPNEYELPEYLLGTIQWVKEQMSVNK